MMNPRIKPPMPGLDLTAVAGVEEVPAYVYTSPDSGASVGSVRRRATGAEDVRIQIDFCGLCHSDIHTVRSEWGQTPYPMTPGHEIVGHVIEVGDDVSRFAVGDRVGVGCLVDSCRECDACLAGDENYCEGRGAVGTYNSKNYWHEDEITQGGYSEQIVVQENFVLNIPEGLDSAEAAPLLCAGITTYSPLKHWGVQEGTRVGVLGLGGLGHMAVKIAHAMGAEVTVFTRSESKVSDAKELGAHHVVISSDEQQMKAARASLDLIIDTVAATHDLNTYLRLLARNGTLVQVGLPDEAMPAVNPGFLISKRRSWAGSNIGGLPETQEMLDFCAEHGFGASIEVVSGEDLDLAYKRMTDSDVKYRFVLDLRAEEDKKDA